MSGPERRARFQHLSTYGGYSSFDEVTSRSADESLRPLEGETTSYSDCEKTCFRDEFGGVAPLLSASKGTGRSVDSTAAVLGRK